MFGRLLKPKVDTAFRVNDRGETTFLLSEFPFQPLNGYVVASDEHAAALRRALRKYHRNFLWVIFVCGAAGGAWVAADRTFLPYLLAVLCVAQVYRSAHVRLVFRKILRDCETAPEDRVPSRGVRAWRPSRYPAGRAGRLRLPRRAA